MANIFSLYGSIFIDNEKANKSIDDTTEKGKKSSTSLKESFGSIVKNATQVGTAVVGATTAITTGTMAFVTNVADTAGDLDDIRQRVGMTAEEFQKYAYVAKMSGVESSTLEKAMVKQQKAFADAKEGSTAMIEAYERLGININEIGTAGESFDLVIKALADMEDETTRNAIANDIFGKSYADLTTIFLQGSEGIDSFKQEVEDLGGVISDEAVEAGANLGDQLDRIKTAIGGAVNAIGAKLMPIISEILQLIIDNLPTIQAMFDALAPVLVNTLQTILPIFMNFVQTLLPILLDLINQLLPPITNIISILLPIFTNVLQIILPPLIQIIQALLPAFLPLIQAILPLLQPITDLLLYLTNTILVPVIGVITSITSVISSGLSVALKALTPVLQGVSKIFSDVFGGLFNVVKTPINFIIDGLNNFIKMLNKIKVPDWVPGVGGKGINIPLIKKLRVGLEYVPYDDMPAMLHKGERVLDADEAREYREKEISPQQESVVNYYNNIIVEKLEVRKESDIKRIAEELLYLQKKKVA